MERRGRGGGEEEESEAMCEATARPHGRRGVWEGRGGSGRKGLQGGGEEVEEGGWMEGWPTGCCRWCTLSGS